MNNLLPIPTFPDYFLDTRTSDVWSFKGAEPLRMKKTLGSNGYYHVCMTLEGSKQKSLPVHQIIWIAHNGLYPTVNDDGKRMVINHINENRTDNRLGNLEVVTFAENVKYNLPCCRKNREVA